ncbi:hypothetical protein [Stratiformator vulcanicus]|uniref:Uncharacterized protein n=1 Tax=Stratiformator vulcanicus TaxID=2527980 RepID=A0A517QVS8_9PLAN|nr:hypothetical protein [Stratiformator vulcanicus]QDT35684.1 hypothetical protein Pan189_00370 [Stratiformator vulcanicus]
MSFLQRFLKTNPRDGRSASRPSSFRDLTEDQIEAHLAVSRYGRFTLTDAVRPSYDLQVVPRAGYRHDTFTDRENGVNIPVLMAAASREVVFDLFMDLLGPLGEEVDVVLETSHDKSNNSHHDLYRDHIDLPVLRSTMYDFEESILDDGCLGIAALNPRIPLEVQLDEHKLLIVYGQDLEEFEETFREYGLKRDDELKFITEAEHVHSSTDDLQDEFTQLKYRLGVED